MLYETYSAEETAALGEKIGKEAQAGEVYTLIGDLGVGKTVFTQGMAEGLGIQEPICSPTFMKEDVCLFITSMSIGLEILKKWTRLAMRTASMGKELP